MKIENLFLSVVLIAFSITSLVYASTFLDNSQSNFDSGNYSWTFYNSSGFVQLNSSVLNGTFTSRIFSAGSPAQWNNISWIRGGYYQQELPSNNAIETGLSGANMTGNILLWHMNEGVSSGGTLIDSSGNGNNATTTFSSGGTCAGINGKFNSACNFASNSNNYAGLNINFPSAVTISAWATFTGGAGYGMLWTMDHDNKGPDLFFYTGNIYLNTWDGAGNPFCAIPATATSWHLYTTVISSGNTQLYIDGISCGSAIYRDPTSTSFYLGSNAGYDWIGNIDEVAVWNRTLSAAEIMNIYKRGALKLNLSVQSCSNSDCSGGTWKNLGNNLTSPQTLSIANNTYFQYKFDFATDNISFTPQLYNVSINYNTLDITPPNIALNYPLNGINTSSTSLTFNFTATDDTAATLNCGLYIDNINVNSNSSILNGTLTSLNASGLAGGLHYWNVSCTDLANNQNWSQTRSFYIDNSAPTFSNLVYYPNSTDEVDPGKNITFNATVTDNWIGVNTVILQYYNGTTWSNKTMSASGNHIYNATITTVPSEQNYTFNIWANDSLGNTGNSSSTSFLSTWDCTWGVSPSSLEEIVGFYEDKFIGNITLINTGDKAYSNNNCSISFTTGYTGFSSNYWSADSWATNQRGFQMTSPIVVNASSNQTFSISASFPSTATPFTETPLITITSSINNSVTGNKTANVMSTLVIAPPNPLLYQEITTYPSTYVYLTPGNFSLEAYVRNLGYDASNSLNTTALNVSLNWTMPPDLSSRVSDGNLTSLYETLNTSSKQYSNLTIALTPGNILSMPKGTFNITIYSYGYQNNSGNLSLIENSGGHTLLNKTISIQFLCYDTSDGVCVSACGVGVDPDCKAADTSSSSSPAGGGGGGGGGSGSDVTSVATSADFQLVRGEQNEVKIVFKNPDVNQSLKDITFSVSGKIAKYIEINPKELSELGPGEEIELLLNITSPTYIDLGKQELVVTMIAKKGISDYIDSKKITLEIHELSLSSANQMLNDSRSLILQLNEANLSSDSLSNLLNQSEEAITSFKLETVRDNYNTIKDQVKYALDTQKMIIELESLINSSEEKSIDVSEASRLLSLAKLSLERREFDQAYKRAKDAQLTYALEVKGEFGSLGYYLKTYPKELSFGALFLIVFSFGSYNLNKLRLVKKRIKELKEEEKILNELIRIVQKECFKDKKMSMTEYETAMKEYNKKISSVVEELIELETKRAYMLRFKSKTKRLQIEKEKIIDLIKELQEDYMKKRTLETRTYELKMESFNKRISEIEERLATMEAMKAVKGIGISLTIPKEE